MNPEIVAPDRDVRERALDCTRSFIVQAPAGSGKTELLIQRLLKLLACVERPEEIVAITFTNKAAAEMQERVMRALARAAEATPPADSHAWATWSYARAALARDRERGWQLAAHPARLPIMTIDALCAGLARRLPVTAGLGALPAIAQSAAALYREAARRTFAHADTPALREAWARLLGHLDNRIGAVLDLLAAMLSRRDQWLKHVVGNASDADLRARLEASLQLEVRMGLAYVGALLPESSLAPLRECARYAAANLQREGKVSPLAALGRNSDSHTDDPSVREAWRGLCNFVLTDANEWRKRYDTSLGFPAASDAKGEERARRTQMKDAARALVQELATVSGLREALARVRCLPPPRYSDAQWAVVEALLRLLPHAAAQLELVFGEAGEVDFAQLQLAALRALGEEDAPTDLLLALDHRIRHILVDEFQDTSAAQYALLTRLTAGWEDGDGRTLFVVGDPMQSIYRFREAEVALYLQARAQGIGSLYLEPLSLSANFRSQAGLVTWVNTRLARIFPAAEDVDTGAVAFSPAQSVRPAQPIAVILQRAQDELAQAQCVVQAVLDARARDPNGSIGILVRARRDLLAVVPALRAAGLTFQAVEIDPLATRAFILDLMSLTFALLQPTDTLSWLAVLRAPWCGLALVDLTTLVQAEREADLYAALHDDERLAQLSPDARARSARVRAVLEPALRERMRVPLASWVRGVWLALGGPACLASESELADVEAYFEALDAHAQGGELPDRDAFRAGLERLYAAPDANGDARLQILTLHKAKGLEWDTVILPGLHRIGARDEPPLLRWRSPERGGLLLAPIKARGGNDEVLYDYLGLLAQAEDEQETARLLYVAITRARECVYLMGCLPPAAEEKNEPVPRKDSLLAALWPAIGGEFAALPITQAVAASAAVKPTLRRLPADWVRPLPAPGLPWMAQALPEQEPGTAIDFDWARESARHVGTLVHRVLLQIGREGRAKWSVARVEALRSRFAVELARLGVPEHEREQAVERSLHALRVVLEDPRGKWIFDSAQREVQGELALTAVEGHRIVNVVLDRAFVDPDGRRWIIDFKTSAHEGGEAERFLDNEVERYRAQLETYARIWQIHAPGPVWLGLYFPLLRGWREWEVR